jgi:hypothetical protein
MFRKLKVEQGELKHVVAKIAISVVVVSLILGVLDMLARYLWMATDVFRGTLTYADASEPSYPYSPKHFWGYTQPWGGDWLLSHLFAIAMVTSIGIVALVCGIVCDIVIRKYDNVRYRRSE